MRRLLMNPGPTNVHADVRGALLAPDICHRDEDFGALLRRVCAKLVRVAGGSSDHDAIPFVASGTGANEAMLGTVNGRVLTLVAGRYAERLFLMGTRLLGAAAMTRLDFASMDGIDVAAVRRALTADPNISHICVVHHETSSGLMAPLSALGRLCRDHGVQLLVDGISSIGGHEFDLVGDNIAFATVSANKCLESVPGISFLLGRKQFFEASKGMARSFYFDVYQQWLACHSHDGPAFTAATPLFFAMDVALDRLIAETVRGRAKRYGALKRSLQQGLRRLKVQPVEVAKSFQSNILTLCQAPDGFPYDHVRDALRGHGITIHTDTETANNGMWMLATLGDMNERDVDYFLSALGAILRGAPVSPRQQEVTNHEA